MFSGMDSGFFGGTTAFGQGKDYNCRVKKIILIPTNEGGYQNVMQRSFTLNASAAELRKLEAAFAANNVGLNNNISESAISKAVPSLVSLNSIPLGTAEIVNGWGTRRFRFLLVTETTSVNGSISESYIQGYSEYLERSASGKIDPNMFFHINSITNVNKLIDPVTNSYHTRVTSTFNIISNKFGGSKYQEVEGNTDFQLIRPTDILNGIRHVDLYDNKNFLLDNTNRISSQANTSKRSNTNGMEYLTNTLNKFIDAKSLASTSYDRSDIFKDAMDNLSEHVLGSVPLLFAISDITGEYTPSSFTINLLKMIDPNTENRIIDPSFGSSGFGTMNNLSTPNFINTFNTSEMVNPKLETLIVLKTINTINSLMCDNMFSVLGLMITNVNGFYEVVPGAFDSFIDGLNDDQKIKALNRIIAKVKEILLPDITNLNNIVLEMSFYSDMLGDTVVGIKLTTGYTLNQEEVIYRLPTFADSLFTPMVSNTGSKNVLQEDFSNITELTYNLN